jgi:hypothetical protein
MTKKQVVHVKLMDKDGKEVQDPNIATTMLIGRINKKEERIEKFIIIDKIND